MGQKPTNLLPKNFKTAAEQKSDVGVLKPMELVEYKGKPAVVFQTNLRNGNGEVSAANTVMTDAQMKASIERLMTDHLKHDHLDQNVETLRYARENLKSAIGEKVDLRVVTDKDISSITLRSKEGANHGIQGDPIGDLIKNTDEFTKAANAASLAASDVREHEKAGDTRRLARNLDLNLTP